ncbi:GIY-YIG nuclease family protein [Planctomicrobium sp. SH664]|uniref:GIY-YIG nuclease family protein n=1 Tax=Planctomicrobium sp. SH664 TaxID=3448125 RepID=UPI003F5BE852
MAKKKNVTEEDLDLLEELGVETEPEAAGGRTPREQRIIAGFEEIERFFEANGRGPEHGEGRDIFERMYAVRLDRIRESEECRTVLSGLDKHGLLGSKGSSSTAATSDADQDDEALLQALGIDLVSQGDITNLVHVRPRAEIKGAEEIAQRTPCPDFHLFKPLFETVQQELEAGERKTVKYGEQAAIKEGHLFILDGQKVFVAKVGDEFVTDYGKTDRRLRVIYDNGTESDLLLRSLQRALYKDDSSRRITDREQGELLFLDNEEEGDQATGSVYVLRSLSDHPFLAEHRKAIHKIGVTGGSVKKRVANARKDPTFLLADVEIVAEYKLANINRKALEALIHRFFANARLDLELKDRFGAGVEPREWFLLPLPVIDEMIEKIKDGTIGDVAYDSGTARLRKSGKIDTPPRE